MLFLAIFAALLRLPALDRVPPGFQFDEAYNILDALDVLAGQHRLFLPANGGREVLYTYLQAPWVALLGPTAQAGRVASALIGIVTVVVLYIFVRRIWPDYRRLAVLAGVLLALSYWHLHFSRYGIRSILMPLWYLLSLLAFWRGLNEGRPGQFILSGLWAATGVWTHPVGRLLPVVILLWLALTMPAYREYKRTVAKGIALTGSTALVLFAPLAGYFCQHPLQFYAHASDVSMIEPGDWIGTLVALAQNAWRVLLMFNVRGDAAWIHNWPGRPVFDIPIGLAFLLGVVLMVQSLRKGSRIERLAGALLLAWSVTLITVSVVTDMAPNFSRMIGALPVFVITAALGLDSLASQAERRLGHTAALAALAGVLALSGGLTSYDYFVRFATAARSRGEYDTDKVEAAAFLSSAATSHTVFLTELWSQHATMQVLTRDIDVRSLNPDAAMVLPQAEGKGALYAFPPEQRATAEAVHAAWADWGELTTVYDAQGRDLLYVLTIPEQRLADARRAGIEPAQAVPGNLHPTDLALGDAVKLRGWRVADQPSADGHLAVTLLWECVAPLDRDLTAYVHLIDSDGAKVAQIDQEPGAGSYEVSEWRVGDLILDYYPVPLPAIMPAGEYHLSLGLYRLSSAESGASQTTIASARVGAFTFDGAVPAPADALTAAVTPIAAGSVLSVQVPAQFELLAPTTAALVVDGRAAVTGGAWRIQLVSASTGFTETAGTFICPQVSEWAEVERVVLASTLIVSAVSPGDYRLQLVDQADGYSVDLGPVSVSASQRVWALPRLDIELDARLGDWVRLAGVSSASFAEGQIHAKAGQELCLALTWQAEAKASQSLSTFVHLVDANGQIITQYDGVPLAGRYPTTDWLPREVVTDTVTLSLPQGMSAGAYRLLIGLYDPVSGRREPVEQDGAPIAEEAVSLSMRVTGD